MANGDTYAIHHMGETTWMSGSTAVARWLCDNYGLKLDRMPRLVGDTELHRYQRLLATHDWTFGYSDDSRAFSAGATERARLNMIAAQLDPDRKLWEEYARCE